MKIKYIKANNNSVVNVAARDIIISNAEVLNELKELKKEIQLLKNTLTKKGK